MLRTNDNWEKLVDAVVKKQQLWDLFHAQSRTPSTLSDASDSRSTHDLGSPFLDLSFEFPNFRSASAYKWLPDDNTPVSSKSRLVFIADFQPLFDLKDISSSSVKMTGRDAFGPVYTVTLDIGLTIVIKKLELTSIPEKVFVRHMQVIGRTEHENLVALRAYYFSDHEKAILYDYYDGGSVHALLYGKAEGNLAYVNWSTRIRIAIGAARGVSFIHSLNGMVHGNIRASNIFINSQGYGCVSDFGLANMISPIFTSSSRCIAPEIETTQRVSQASDVYSFGTLLLELVTRIGDEAVDVVKWVRSVVPENWSTQVFDEDLKLNPVLEKQITRMLDIGLICSVESPGMRPKMSAVVRMIEDICVMSL